MSFSKGQRVVVSGVRPGQESPGTVLEDAPDGASVKVNLDERSSVSLSVFPASRVHPA